MAFFALANASNFENKPEDIGEARTILSTNTGSFLTLNSTSLNSVAIGGVLIVLVLLVILGPGLVGDRFRAYRRQGQGVKDFTVKSLNFKPDTRDLLLMVMYN